MLTRTYRGTGKKIISAKSCFYTFASYLNISGLFIGFFFRLYYLVIHLHVCSFGSWEKLWSDVGLDCICSWRCEKSKRRKGKCVDIYSVIYLRPTYFVRSSKGIYTKKYTRECVRFRSRCLYKVVGGWLSPETNSFLLRRITWAWKNRKFSLNRMVINKIEEIRWRFAQFWYKNIPFEVWYFGIYRM